MCDQALYNVYLRDVFPAGPQRRTVSGQFLPNCDLDPSVDLLLSHRCQVEDQIGSRNERQIADN